MEKRLVLRKKNELLSLNRAEPERMSPEKGDSINRGSQDPIVKIYVKFC